MTDWHPHNFNLDDNASNVLNQFQACLEANDIKGARELMRTYSVFNQLNTRKLNKLFHIPGYKFTKRNEQLTLYKPLHAHQQEESIDESVNESVDESVDESAVDDESVDEPLSGSASVDEPLRRFHRPEQSSRVELAHESLNDIHQKMQQMKNNIDVISKQMNYKHESLYNAVERKIDELTDSMNRIIAVVNSHQQQLECLTQKPTPMPQMKPRIDNRPYHYIKADGVNSRYDEQKPMSAYSTQKPQPKQPPKNTAAVFREEQRKKAEEELKKQQVAVKIFTDNKPQTQHIKELQ